MNLYTQQLSANTHNSIYDIFFAYDERGEIRALKITSPIELLTLLSPDIYDQRVQLYPWQIEYHKVIAKDYTREKPLLLALVANNGSGKSVFCVSPVAVWLSLFYHKAHTVVTSASGSQLDKQSGRYIKDLCERFNRLLGEKIFDIKYREVICIPTESIITLFATDEAGKAEGWHALDTNREFTIITDESKSINDEIFKALERCNDFTRKIEVSSTGNMCGHFFRICTRKDLGWLVMKVTALQCPDHISQAQIRRTIMEYGENSPLVRSMFFSEFVSDADQTVMITPSSYVNCYQMGVIDRETPWVKHPSDTLYAGFDIALGGENLSVITIRNGNKVIAVHQIKTGSEETLKVWAIGIVKKYGLSPGNVFADAGGIGKPILSGLEFKGYTFNKVYNQSPPVNKRSFKNKNAENWFRIKRLIEGCHIILPDLSICEQHVLDMIQSQLTSRRYEFVDDKYVIEEKGEYIGRGFDSPDYADSMILCFSGYSIGTAVEEKKADERYSGFNRYLEEVVKEMNNGGDPSHRDSSFNRFNTDSLVKQVSKQEKDRGVFNHKPSSPQQLNYLLGELDMIRYEIRQQNKKIMSEEERKNAILIESN